MPGTAPLPGDLTANGIPVQIMPQFITLRERQHKRADHITNS
jgi:hypothetical protein